MLIVVVVGIGVGVYFLKKGQSSLFNTKEHLTDKERYSVGENLAEGDAGYAQALQYLNADNLNGALDELVLLRDKYATGTQERMAVEYSIGSFQTFHGDHYGAIETLKRIILDYDSYNKTTRSLAVETLARTYWTTLDPGALKAIFSKEQYFTEILSEAEGNYEDALYLLLKQGYDILGTPIAAARLAQRESLKLLTGDYVDEAEKQQIVSRFEEYALGGTEKIEAFASFKSYQTYRADFYSTYGAAVQNAVLSGVPTKFSREDVEKSYQTAYALASGSSKPYIIYRYGSFLSVTTSTDNAKIEDLSKRLVELPAGDKRTFDLFIYNVLTLKTPIQPYGLLIAYRKASPTFDAYAANVLKKKI